MTGYNMENGYKVIFEGWITNGKGVSWHDVVLDRDMDHRNYKLGEKVLIDGKEYEYTVAMESYAYLAIRDQDYEGSLMGKTIYFKH